MHRHTHRHTVVEMNESMHSVRVSAADITDTRNTEYRQSINQHVSAVQMIPNNHLSISSTAVPGYQMNYHKEINDCTEKFITRHLSPCHHPHTPAYTDTHTITQKVVTKLHSPTHLPANRQSKNPHRPCPVIAALMTPHRNQ